MRVALLMVLDKEGNLMFQKFKITFYALIVLLVLALPSQVGADNPRTEYDDFGNTGTGFANSCKGWDCAQEGLLCLEGRDGAKGTSFICANKKWGLLEVDSCKGWDCSHEGQICPKGADGAKGTSFICRKSKWEPVTCQDMKDNQYVQGIEIVCRGLTLCSRHPNPYGPGQECR